MNNTGNNNTALGDSALYSNTSGIENTAGGQLALFTNSTGNYNTAFGKAALYFNTASGNTAFGHTSLYSNTSGQFNSAFGTTALSANTTGYSNSAFGTGTLNDNTTGYLNTAIGHTCLDANTTGNSNTAVGAYALSNNTTGAQNSAFGYFALIYNQTGGNNCAFGIYSNGSNLSGSTNSSFGDYSLYNNLAGANTGIGFHALYTNTTGIRNTALGANADVGAATYTNATALGYGAVVSATNKVRIGNTNVTVVEGQVAYTNPSDGRFKTNIKEEDVKGLAFIKKLRPVAYNFDTRKFTEFLTKNMPDSIKKNYLSEDFKASTAIRQSGFIAQEVEQAAKEVNYDFNGLHKPANDHDNYGLAYGQFVVPLVKAVQEQQAMIEQQNKTISDLKEQLATLTRQQSGNGASSGSLPTSLSEKQLGDGFGLEQNMPNPFTHETVIKYSLPATVNTAYLAVYDLSGKQLTTLPVTQKGNASLTLNSSQLAPGIYIYSIVADGALIGSRRMVIADK